jgi:phosphohistidine phosphatase SixA
MSIAAIYLMQGGSAEVEIADADGRARTLDSCGRRDCVANVGAR